MDTVFLVLLMAGLLLGLVCVCVGIALLTKRYARRTIEVEIKAFGKIKTTQTGVVLIFLGLFLFGFSQRSYARAKEAAAVRSQLDNVIIATAKNLREEYRAIIALRKPPIETNEFSRVTLLIHVLEQLDLENGHAFYYAGEVKRAEGFKKEAQADFYRYLEKLDTLPESQKGGSTGVEICYDCPDGYCRQRTAWIRHLLANDFYDDAVAETNAGIKLYLYQTALNYADGALRDFPPRGFGGPGQLTPTTVLKEQALAAMAALRKSRSAK